MSKHLINKCFLLKIPTLLFGITLHAQITAQDSAQIKHAVRAAQYCQEGLYEKAEQSIALALASDDEKDALYTWYVNGFIHKEIYKVRESNKLHSKHRDLAVEAFLKSKDLAGNHSDVYNNNSALKYLANTYYNDAISLAGSFEIENELEPDTLLYTYEWLCKQMSTEGVNKSLFYKQKGLRYQELWQNNVCDLSLNEKSFACYQTSLDYDKNDCDSFYNAGVLRYSIIQQYRNGASAISEWRFGVL